jgi:hypothetical protein
VNLLTEQLSAIEKMDADLQIKAQEYSQVAESNNPSQISNSKKEMDVSIQVLSIKSLINNICSLSDSRRQI